MIAIASLGAEIGFKSKKPKVIESDLLKTSLLWVMASLSCVIALLLYIIALLEAKILFSLLRVAKLYGRFF